MSSVIDPWLAWWALSSPALYLPLSAQPASLRGGMIKMLPLPEPSAASALWSAAGIAILLLVCGYIGFQSKTTTFENYLVGERNLGPVITGAAVAAGYLSGWAALGMMGVTYTVGWSGMCLPVSGPFWHRALRFVCGPQIQRFQPALPGANSSRCSGYPL